MVTVILDVPVVLLGLTVPYASTVATFTFELVHSKPLFVAFAGMVCAYSWIDSSSGSVTDCLSRLTPVTPVITEPKEYVINNGRS